ncbi:MAG: hypothetical protein ABSG43_28750, partial [Solirubrobacteraceae bacterium]
MRRGSMLGLALLACLLALTGGAGLAGAASQTATAPEQLVHAYPLGPQRLCCGGHTSTPRSSPASKQRSGPTARRGGSQGGLSSAIWIAAVAGGALLTAAAAGGIYITRQRFSGIATQVAGIVPPHRGTGVLAPGHGDERRYPAGDFNLGVLLHERQDYAAAAAAYRRAELLGDNDAAFNLGVLLYETG